MGLGFARLLVIMIGKGSEERSGTVCQVVHRVRVEGKRRSQKGKWTECEVVEALFRI